MRCHGTIRGGSAACKTAEDEELGTAIAHARAVVANGIATRIGQIWTEGYNDRMPGLAELLSFRIGTHRPPRCPTLRGHLSTEVVEEGRAQSAEPDNS
jgi:hypothetical protein